MNISNVPTAINHAIAQSSRLTQLSSGLVVRQEGSNSNPPQANLITTSLFASDNGYTKEDAIMKQWNKQGSFNLYDVLNGGKVNLQDPNPSAEVLQKFEKQLQASGIQKEVDWSSLMFDLKGIGFDDAAAAYTIGADDFSRKTDYLASRYVAVENKIKSTTTGTTQAEQLKKLDEMYQSALGEIADGYSGIVGSFLEENGVNGEKEKIHSSIISGVESRIEEYRKGLTGNAALEGLNGTQDQWLLNDDAYVAAVLRESVSTPANSQSKSADIPYTLKDLNALGQYASALSAMEKPNNTNIYTMDEARIGLDFSMLAMKTDTLRSSNNITDAMAGLLQKTTNGFMQSFLDRLDSQLSANRKAGVTAGDQTGFAALDRNMVWDVYNQTMEHYRGNGDAIQALIKGAEYGVAKMSSRSASGAYRHQDNASYWANFFKKSAKDGHLGAYDSPDTTLQKYMSGWLDFKSSLDDGKSVRLNLALNATAFYTAGQNYIMSRTV